MPKKQSSDHSSLGIPIPEFFSTKESEELKKKYNFSENYNLHIKLNQVFEYRYLQQKPQNQITATENKRRLKAVLSHSDALLEALNDLSQFQKMSLLTTRYLDEFPFIQLEGKYPKIALLKRGIGQLNKASRKALNDLPKARIGRQKERMEIDQFVVDLRKTFIEGTGIESKYTYDPVTESYSKGCFPFVKEMLERNGIKKTDKKIAKIISRTSEYLSPF